MTAVYEWVRNITYYMIFITVVGNLLADSKYEKYLRFFAGMILILLVLKPLTGSLRLDERIAYLFESISFQKEADDFKEKLWGMEDQRLERVMSTYEEAVAMDIRGMADTAGFAVRAVKVTIETDRSNPLYGHVTDLYMKLAPQKGENAAGAPRPPSAPEDGGDSGFGGPVDVQIEQQQIQVEPVRIGDEGSGAENAGSAADPGAAEGNETAVSPPSPLSGEEAAAVAVEQSQILARTFPANLEERTKINAFIRKVAGYYGLETAHVQVEWEND